MLDEAAKACLNVEGQKERTINLQSCILYEKGDITGMCINTLLAMHFLHVFFLLKPILKNSAGY